MATEQKGPAGNHQPSNQEARKASLEMHQMDIQRVLSISLAATDDLIEGLNLCLEAGLQISGMDCGGIYLFDDTFEKLNLIVHKGLSNAFVKDVSTYDKDAGVVALIRKCEPLYTLEQDLDAALVPENRHEGLRALACLPLCNESVVLGCINLASHVFDEISPSSRIAVETIAAQAGNVIARLQAQRKLQESEEHLSSLMLNAEHYAVYRLRYSDSDPRGLKVVFVSPSIMDIMGVADPKKFETWFDNVHADDRERIEKANMRAFETKEFNEVMKINHPRKRERRWIHSIAKGIFSQRAGIQYVNGIIIDITERKRIEDALVVKEKELESKTHKLEETNIALNVLLKKREEDKILLQEQVLSNIKKLALPYVEKLKKSRLNETQTALMGVIETSLHEIVSPFTLKLSSDAFGFTPVEIKVADLIRQGKGTKEVAAIRNLSHKTVERHRENIRNKLGIKNKKVNLQTHLTSLA